MKLTILKDKLKEGINIIEKTSSRSLSLPILNNILISTEKNFLNITSTDLEMSVKWWALAKIEKEGKTTIPSNIFSSFINFLPSKPVSLKSKEVDLEIKCDNYETLIKGINPEDFPIIPQISDKEKIEVSAKEFCKGLASVVDIASFSSIKPEISGIYLLFQKNLITLTATDSFRLAEKKVYLNTNSNLEKEHSLIIPQKVAKKVISVFSEKEDNLIIYFSNNQILFETYLTETKHPNIQLSSKLIEGDYPDYKEIIPKKCETSIIVSLEELINQIKLASLFSGRINEIKLKVDPKKNQIDFSSENSEVGEYQSFLKAKIEGSPCEVSFNYKFLLDGLTSLSSQQSKKSNIILELNGSEKAAIVRQEGEDNYLYLVMPIKNS